MSQSATGLAGRNNTDEVTPLPCPITPLKGEDSDRGLFSMRKQSLASALIGITLSVSAMADTTDTILKRLREMYPATKFSALRETPAAGIYEVIVGNNVAYTNEVGRYWVFGSLYDMQTQRDLTAGVLDEINRFDVSSLPTSDAIISVRGVGERKLWVFSDPDCPYCKKLEQELLKIDNVTVYTYLYPLESLHPEAKKKSIHVWCSPDRASAWKALMTTPSKDAGTTDSQCDHPIDRNIKLATQHRINGTPTMIFGNGKKASGALPAAEIERRLVEAAKVAGGK